MKDRLTEILKKCFKGSNSIEELADKLIAEGVILLPQERNEDENT
jgi:hypothetical protein